MAEVQAHGFGYEDQKIKERTGISKKEYDSMKKNGYTSEFDLIQGLLVDYNGSVKTTKNNTICCGDILKKISHKDYHLIVGVYKQQGKIKVFHTEYEFFITPEDYKTLWGSMEYEQVKVLVDYVKKIPRGKEDKQTKLTRNFLKEEIQCENALFTINPKIDSAKQRRVQCSLHIDKLIAAGIKYNVKSIDYTFESGPRQFSKKKKN